MTSLYLFDDAGACQVIVQSFSEAMAAQIAQANGAASYLISELVIPMDRARNVGGVLTDVPRTPTNEELSAQARTRRDELLIQSDWTDTVSAQTRLGPVVWQVWMDYRQALRDVPQQAGFPTSIDWPAAP